MEELADGIFAATQYPGANVGAIVTADGVICIDSPSYPRDARHWVTQVNLLSLRGVRYTVLTDWQGDRILNTRWLNAPIIAHQTTAEKLTSYEKRYPQHLIDALTNRRPEGGRDFSSGPVDRCAVSFSGELTLVTTPYRVILSHRPGPTPANIWVRVPELGILFVGDSVALNCCPPPADLHLGLWLASLESLLAAPDAATIIVPGRGPVGSLALVEQMADYLRQIDSTIRQHVRDNLLREQTSLYVDQFAEPFLESRLAPEWVRKKVRLALERVYDEIKSDLERECPQVDG